MKHYIPFLIFQLFGFLACGQVTHWESYFQPSRAQHHLEEENRLWLPTDVGLLEVNKETGEHTLWNKEHGGLSSNSIEAVARHPITRELFIGTYDVGRGRPSFFRVMPLMHRAGCGPPRTGPSFSKPMRKHGSATTIPTPFFRTPPIPGA